MPISTIKAKDVLLALQKIEARGDVGFAHKIKQLSGQIFRYAIAAGLAEHDVTALYSATGQSAATQHW